MAEPRRLVLASGSAARRAMLEAAGIAFEVHASSVDEEAVRETLTADNADIDPADIAEVLARAKAEDVSRRFPDAVVIGADQVLSLGREILTKSADLERARVTLMKLRGTTHQLHAAVAVAEAGEAGWATVDTASLTTRSYSASFVADYLARTGARVCRSVGAYEIEGLGINLFEHVEGDHFTILGMPLLPLLAELRRREVITS